MEHVAADSTMFFAQESKVDQTPIWHSEPLPAEVIEKSRRQKEQLDDALSKMGNYARREGRT